MSKLLNFLYCTFVVTIGYYWLDIDRLLFDYFSEAETDSIEDALVELGEDEFSEEEIRLMRIKFLSEVGN